MADLDEFLGGFREGAASVGEQQRARLQAELAQKAADQELAVELAKAGVRDPAIFEQLRTEVPVPQSPTQGITAGLGELLGLGGGLPVVGTAFEKTAGTLKEAANPNQPLPEVAQRQRASGFEALGSAFQKAEDEQARKEIQNRVDLATRTNPLFLMLPQLREAAMAGREDAPAGTATQTGGTSIQDIFENVEPGSIEEATLQKAFGGETAAQKATRELQDENRRALKDERDARLADKKRREAVAKEVNEAVEKDATGQLTPAQKAAITTRATNEGLTKPVFPSDLKAEEVSKRNKAIASIRVDIEALSRNLDQTLEVGSFPLKLAIIIHKARENGVAIDHLLDQIVIDGSPLGTAEGTAKFLNVEDPGINIPYVGQTGEELDAVREANKSRIIDALNQGLITPNQAIRVAPEAGLSQAQSDEVKVAADAIDQQVTAASIGAAPAAQSQRGEAQAATPSEPRKLPKITNTAGMQDFLIQESADFRAANPGATKEQWFDHLRGLGYVVNAQGQVVARKK